MLLAVPNLSEGRDPARVHRLVDAFLDPAAAPRLPLRRGPQPHRRVAGRRAGGARRSRSSPAPPRPLAEVDMAASRGRPPCVGRLDVCPLVLLRGGRPRARPSGAALAVADRLAADLGVPVFLYGELATRRGAPRARLLPRRRARAAARADGGGRAGGRPRPAEPHPTAGATLVTARPPLAAFNVFLDSPDPKLARLVAAGVRESGGGLPGVRAIGSAVRRRDPGLDQRPRPARGSPLAEVVAEVRAPGRAARRPRDLGGDRRPGPERRDGGFPEDVELVDPDAGAHIAGAPPGEPRPVI